MPVQERDYLKSGQAPATAKTPAWLARLNELGERHATAIIAISTGLIILIVLLFAKGAYDRSQAQRAQTDLSTAETVEALRTLKSKYGSTPAAPLISYRLAGELYDEGKPAEALEEYQAFRRRWPGHALSDRAAVAVETIEKNIKFADERKSLLEKQAQLQSHPRQLAESKDPRLQHGPLREPAPVVELALPSGPVRLELLRYDAGPAAEQVLELVKKNAFEGQKWEVVGEQERLQLQAPTSTAPAVEAGPVSAEPGAVALVKKDGEATALLQIFLKPAFGVKDARVVGRVTEGLDRLSSVKKDEAVPPLKLADSSKP